MATSDGGNIKRLTIALGVLFSIAAESIYFWHGYSQTMLILWVFGLSVTGVGFKLMDSSTLTVATPDDGTTKVSRWQNSKYRRDLFVILGLIVFCAPLYLAYVHSLPVQMNTDEIAIMGVQKTYASAKHVDPFGLSTYAGLPSLVFIVTGKLGLLLGGINLYHMRLIHGFFGIVIVIMAYLFFRLRLSRPWAFTAAIILGTNHALLMISRMAMRENTALLIELAALALLFFGFTRSSRLWTFVGCAVAGLSFYTYFPSRITIVIWLVFISCWVVCFTPKKDRIERFNFGLICLLGFFMIIAPNAIASSRNFNSANSHPRQQILLYQEGRRVQQTWVNANTPKTAYKQNVSNGLSVFNNKIQDYGYIYPNSGHGFVDPLSGVLVWIGFLVVLWRVLHRRSRQSYDLLMVISFITIWVVLALVINKAPNYTRLLVILPFSSYMVTQALQLLAEYLSKHSKCIQLGLETLVYNAILLIGLVSIVGWNLLIARDFIKQGQINGNTLGSTARYIEARANQPTYRFYLAADANYAYYDWGDPQQQWQRWIGFFVTPPQLAQVISPNNVSNFNQAPRPYTIFMNERLWRQHKANLTLSYPDLRVHPITSNGQLLAIEIP